MGECGEKEFAFIRISGFYFGFLFGCVQMAILFFFSKSWFMPICGFIVSWFTNYLALKVIFRPLVPVKIGPFTIHGLFFTRQNEVSETFADIEGLLDVLDGGGLGNGGVGITSGLGSLGGGEVGGELSKELILVHVLEVDGGDGGDKGGGEFHL